MFDHGELWHQRLAPHGRVCSAAEAARRTLEARHGEPVFVPESTFTTDDDGAARAQPPSFAACAAYAAYAAALGPEHEKTKVMRRQIAVIERALLVETRLPAAKAAAQAQAQTVRHVHGHLCVLSPAIARLGGMTR